MRLSLRGVSYYTVNYLVSCTLSIYTCSASVLLLVHSIVAYQFGGKWKVFITCLETEFHDLGT
jgi:hypothetical protein